MGTLYVVSTPIGNLEDVTLRALRTLREADLLLAEDTRHSRVLLQHHGVSKPLRSLHAHNEAEQIRSVIQRLKEEASVVLISDAGTPLISDPGGRLVAAVLEAGYPVIPIPGPSAVLAALVASGLPSEPFCFLGFLPRKEGAQTRLLETYRGRPETLVIFESPRRVESTLRTLERVLGDRRACVARELTKLYEEAARGKLSELAEKFSEGVRGEVTIVVEGELKRATSSVLEEQPELFDEEIRSLLLEERSSKDIAEQLAEEHGVKKRDVYARVVTLREEN